MLSGAVLCQTGRLSGLSRLSLRTVFPQKSGRRRCGAQGGVKLVGHTTQDTGPDNAFRATAASVPMPSDLTTALSSAPAQDSEDPMPRSDEHRGGRFVAMETMTIFSAPDANIDDSNASVGF